RGTKTLERLDGHGVVALALSGSPPRRPVRFGDAHSERENRRSTAGIGDSGKGERVGEVLPVGLAGCRQLLVVAQVVVAVRKPEARMPQVQDIGVRVLVVGLDVATE